MVNYCCIQGCNRNSRTHKNLNFFSLPKDKNRQKKWLQLAGREDLIERDLERLRRSLRVCSRHFSYNFKVKNRYLSHDALPSKKLPGSLASDESDIEPADHEGVICDNCSESVIGFRYKCVSCENYDLCQKCEMVGSHPQHYMLRIPKSIKFQTAENLLSKWQRFFNSEHVTPLNVNEMSSDDEPVTKYIKIRNYDSGMDLSEDVKRGIRTEIDRALKSVEAKKKSVETSGSNVILNNLNTVKTPELEFADVNEYNQSDVKVEDHSIAVPQDQPQPMFFMKLSGDLSDLMIELTPNKES